MSEETTLSTFCSEILTGIFIKMALFVITVYNSLEKLTRIENNHCVFVCLFNTVVGSFPVEVKFSQVISQLYSSGNLVGKHCVNFLLVKVRIIKVSARD